MSILDFQQAYIHFEGFDEVIHWARYVQDTIEKYPDETNNMIVSGHFEMGEARYPMGTLLLDVGKFSWRGYREQCYELYSHFQCHGFSKSNTVADSYALSSDCAYLLTADYFRKMHCEVQDISPAFADLMWSWCFVTAREAREYVDRCELFLKPLIKDRSRKTEADSFASRQQYYAAQEMLGNQLGELIYVFPHQTEWIHNNLQTPDHTLCKAALNLLERWIQMLDNLDSLSQKMPGLISHTLCDDNKKQIADSAKALAELESGKVLEYKKLFSMEQNLRMRTRHCISADGEVSSAVYYSSDDCASFVFLEFTQACVTRRPVIRCLNCGDLHLPSSGHVKYCDKIIDPKLGLTCKQLGPKLKHAERVDNDPARKFFFQQRNKINMRCSRAKTKTLYDMRDAWKKIAEQELERYDAGTITLEEFKQKIEVK